MAVAEKLLGPSRTGGIEEFARRSEVYVGLLKQLMATPLPLPPVFFSHKPPHRIQVSLGPQPKTPGEPVLVIDGTSFMLQIGGYIAGLSKSAAGKVRRVVVTVGVVRGSDKASLSAFKDSTSNKVNHLNLEKSALSFQGNCLVHFEQGAGSYQIVVRSEIEDDVGERWGSGMSSNASESLATLLVRVAPNAQQGA